MSGGRAKARAQSVLQQRFREIQRHAVNAQEPIQGIVSPVLSTTYSAASRENRSTIAGSRICVSPDCVRKAMLACLRVVAHTAHEICPYSKATRGNIDVALNVFVS